MNCDERMLEDWICQHPDETFWNWGTGTIILDRQVSLQHGIADILAWNRTTFVVELKASKLREKDVGQLLRYCYDVRTELQEFCIEMDIASINEATLVGQRELYYLHNYLGWGEDPNIQVLTPVLIGQAVDEKTLAAAAGADVSVLLWDYRGGRFTFEVVSAPLRQCFHTPWLEYLNILISRLCQEEAEEDFELMVSELFRSG